VALGRPTLAGPRRPSSVLLSGERAYGATVGLGRLALRALQVTSRWLGEEHLPERGPVLLASNHVAYPDFLFVGQAGLARGRHVRFLARHDVWDPPVVGRAMTAMRHVPVDRRAPAAAYLGARALLREGEAVCAFPEAGVSHSYTVRALMPGVAALARELGLPVVPVAVWGTQRLWPLRREVGEVSPRPALTRGRLVDVRFGPPLPVAADADLAATTTELGARLTGLLEGLQRLPEHRPRPGEQARWYPRHLGGTAPTREQARALDEVPRSAVPPTWGPVRTSA
jgi:1-acyl-sn-glycerol-3-phosphate acyltransferase